MTSRTPAAKALGLLVHVLCYVAVGLVVVTVVNVAAMTLADIATNRSHSNHGLHIERKTKR